MVLCGHYGENEKFEWAFFNWILCRILNNLTYINKKNLIQVYELFGLMPGPRLICNTRYDAQRAQTSKNIQKPPHSTLWIPGLFWPKIQKEWSAEVKLFSKISKKRQNLAKNHWETVFPWKWADQTLIQFSQNVLEFKRTT